MPSTAWTRTLWLQVFALVLLPVAVAAQGGEAHLEVEASFVLDTTEKHVVCVEPGADPQELIEEYGLRDVTLVQIPAGAEQGGGWLISHRPPADASEAQALTDELCDDPRICFCETDRCRIYLPEAWGEGLAAPQETTVVEDDEVDRPGGYLILKGEAKTGTGEPLAGGTFILEEEKPTPERFAREDPPEWREDDTEPPKVYKVPEEGKLQDIPIEESDVVVTVGAGWESESYEIQNVEEEQRTTVVAKRCLCENEAPHETAEEVDFEKLAEAFKENIQTEKELLEKLFEDGTLDENFPQEINPYENPEGMGQLVERWGKYIQGGYRTETRYDEELGKEIRVWVRKSDDPKAFLEDVRSYSETAIEGEKRQHEAWLKDQQTWHRAHGDVPHPFDTYELEAYAVYENGKQILIDTETCQTAKKIPREGFSHFTGTALGIPGAFKEGERSCSFISHGHHYVQVLVCWPRGRTRSSTLWRPIFDGNETVRMPMGFSGWYFLRFWNTYSWTPGDYGWTLMNLTARGPQLRDFGPKTQEPVTEEPPPWEGGLRAGVGQIQLYIDGETHPSRNVYFEFK